MPGTFVTGGTGFIGGALLDRIGLDPAFQPVRALVRDRTGAQLVEALGAEPVLGDVLEPDTLRAGMEGCTLAFHVAGVNRMCLRDPLAMFQVNVNGAANVLEAADDAGIARVVHTSSAAALGEEAGAVGSEATEHRGFYLSNYARSKHEAERAVLVAASRSPVEVVVVNPTSVQGPGRSTGTAEFLIEYLNGGRRVVIDTTVSIIDVADCVEGHVLAARHGEPGERYVLSPPATSLRELVAMIDEIAGLRQRVRWLPRPVARPVLMAAAGAAQVLRRDPPICMEMVRVLLHGNAYDGSRAVRELGVEYRPLAATLRRAIEWYVEYGFVRQALPNV